MLASLRVTKIALAIGLLALAACVQAPKPGNAPIPDGARVTHRAVLIGESNTDAVGTVSLYQAPDAGVVVFEPNFRMSAPTGAVIAFGRDGYRPDTRIAKLVRNAGRQSYSIPPNIRPSGYNEIWIWNEKVGQPLGLGRLTPVI
ncbi:MAG: hypothetical protein AAGD13_21565 [Pseudomonadota bacterium]